MRGISSHLLSVKNKRLTFAHPYLISTSYVERANLTIRMTNRSFTRLTDA